MKESDIRKAIGSVVTAGAILLGQTPAGAAQSSVEVTGSSVPIPLTTAVEINPRGASLDVMYFGAGGWKVGIACNIPIVPLGSVEVAAGVSGPHFQEGSLMAEPGEANGIYKQSFIPADGALIESCMLTPQLIEPGSGETIILGF